MIKPCPFCGDTDGELAESSVPDCVSGAAKWAVFCNMCFAEGPTCRERKDAIPAWNHRAKTKSASTSPNYRNTKLED